eukprot:517052_1
MSDISLSILLGFITTLIITYIGSIFGIFAAWKTKTIKEITKDLETNNEALKQQNEKLKKLVSNDLEEEITRQKTNSEELKQDIEDLKEEATKLQNEQDDLHTLTNDFKRMVRFHGGIYNKMSNLDNFKKEMVDENDLIPILKGYKSKLVILKYFYEQRDIEKRIKKKDDDEKYAEQQTTMDGIEWESFIDELKSEK